MDRRRLPAADLVRARYPPYNDRDISAIVVDPNAPYSKIGRTMSWTTTFLNEVRAETRVELRAKTREKATKQTTVQGSGSETVVVAEPGEILRLWQTWRKGGKGEQLLEHGVYAKLEAHYPQYFMPAMQETPAGHVFDIKKNTSRTIMDPAFPGQERPIPFPNLDQRRQLLATLIHREMHTMKQTPVLRELETEDKYINKTKLAPLPKEHKRQEKRPRMAKVLHPSERSLILQYDISRDSDEHDPDGELKQFNKRKTPKLQKLLKKPWEEYSAGEKLDFPYADMELEKVWELMLPNVPKYNTVEELKAAGWLRLRYQDEELGTLSCHIEATEQLNMVVRYWADHFSPDEPNKPIVLEYINGPVNEPTVEPNLEEQDE